jgi:hypothetical protein
MVSKKGKRILVIGSSGLVGSNLIHFKPSVSFHHHFYIQFIFSDKYRGRG